MKIKIVTPALILLVLFLSGCGREESVAGNETDVSVETESNDEVSTEIENASAEAALTETEDDEAASEAAYNKYPLIATPSAAKRIDLVLVSEGIYCIFDREKYGFLTEDGEEITPCIYDIAYPFSEGLACVCQDGKYGYIDSQGETVIPFDYDRATPFVEGLAYFSIGDDYGFMDKTGTQLFSLECDSVSSFQEGLAYFSINGRYGYIDRNGQAAIEPVFDDAGYFQDGLATVMKDGRYGVINRDGELIVATEYDSIEIGDLLINARCSGKYDCFDRTGKAFLEQYDRIGLAKGGNYVYVQKGEKEGLADKEGNVLLKPLYDMVSLLPGEKFLLIRKNELYGVTDLQGKVSIPAVYSDIRYDRYDRNGDSAESGMLVLTDADGRIESMDITDFSEKIPCNYDSIDWISHDRAVVRRDELSGIIDREGNLIEPLVYDMVRILSDGAVWLKNGTEARFYNNRGEAVEDIGCYDDISKEGNCYQIRKNGRYGFLNEEGEEVCSPVYSFVMDYEVYGADNIYVLTEKSLADHNWESRDFVIKTGEPERNYISGALLKNEITPRIRLYQEFMQSADMSAGDYYALISHTTELGLEAYKKTYKLYDINHTGEPILYFKAEPYKMIVFPESYSGFYAIRSNQLVELVSGYECGGSSRGDYACIWYDRKTDQVFPGTRGFYGGFGGYASCGEVYDKKNGEMTCIASFEWICQPISYFSEEQLAHAELVYDGDGEPYTEEMIAEAENGKPATIYLMNDVQTAVEAYQEMAERYQEISFLE